MASESKNQAGGVAVARLLEEVAGRLDPQASPAMLLELVQAVVEDRTGVNCHATCRHTGRVENALHILQTIIDYLPSGITLFGPDLEMIACNERFKSLLSFPDEMFASGLPSFHALILFNAKRGEYGPGDPEQLAAAAVKRARTMKPHVLERVRPDGTVLEIRGQPLPDGGFVTIYTDITERKRVEEEARRLAIYLRNVLDHLPQGVSVVDENLSLVLWNPAMVDVLELPPDFLREGVPLAEMMRIAAERGDFGPGDTEDLIRQRVDQALDLSVLRETRQRASGKTLDVSRRPMMKDGQVAGFVTTYADVTELTRAREALEHMALHDQLTGLANRHKFLERFAIEEERRRRIAEPLSLLLLDIDNFKSFNDRFGHLVGDSCLRFIAGILRQSVRASDLVGRFGGEEFVILMPDTALDGALSAARHLCRKVGRNRFMVAEEAVPVTVSIGVATITEPGATDFDVLLNRADQAVYRAKRDGRNRVRGWRR